MCRKALYKSFIASGVLVIIGAKVHIDKWMMPHTSVGILNSSDYWPDYV